MKINFTSNTIINKVRNDSEEFIDLIKSVGIEEDLLSGLYYKDDSRSENIGVGEFESQLKIAIENNSSAIKLLIKTINNFFSSPDLYNFWRYALLSKHLKYLSDYEMDIKDDIPNCWDAMESFGVDLDSCIQVLSKLNSAVESDEITTEDYQNGLQTVISCYLALALSSDDSTGNVEKLIHLVACNEGIDDASISENTSYGWGEHAVYCRRMLEEFTGVCIEAPEGVDLEADAYFDNIDWNEVADRIMQALG